MKKRTEALEHASVRQYCKAVRTPTIGANFVSLAEQAVNENHSHIRYLEALLTIECEERDRHAIASRIRDAQLPRLKALEEFDFAQAPQIAGFAGNQVVTVQIETKPMGSRTLLSTPAMALKAACELFQEDIQSPRPLFSVRSVSPLFTAC